MMESSSPRAASWQGSYSHPWYGPGNSSVDEQFDDQRSPSFQQTVSAHYESHTSPLGFYSSEPSPYYLSRAPDGTAQQSTGVFADGYARMSTWGASQAALSPDSSYRQQTDLNSRLHFGEQRIHTSGGFYSLADSGTNIDDARQKHMGGYQPASTVVPSQGHQDRMHSFESQDLTVTSAAASSRSVPNTLVDVDANSHWPGKSDHDLSMAPVSSQHLEVSTNSDGVAVGDHFVSSGHPRPVSSDGGAYHFPRDASNQIGDDNVGTVPNGQFSDANLSTQSCDQGTQGSQYLSHNLAFCPPSSHYNYHANAAIGQYVNPQQVSPLNQDAHGEYPFYSSPEHIHDELSPGSSHPQLTPMTPHSPLKSLSPSMGHAPISAVLRAPPLHSHSGANSSSNPWFAPANAEHERGGAVVRDQPSNDASVQEHAVTVSPTAMSTPGQSFSDTRDNVARAPSTSGMKPISYGPPYFTLTTEHAPSFNTIMSSQPPSSFLPASSRKTSRSHSSLTIRTSLDKQSDKQLKSETTKRGGSRSQRQPHIACTFCRKRKIACIPGPSNDKDVGPCMPCSKRELVCQRPPINKRGHRKRSTSASGDAASASGGEDVNMNQDSQFTVNPSISEAVEVVSNPTLNPASPTPKSPGTE